MYNVHLMHLSKVFSAVDSGILLPNRNPFDRKPVSRKRKSELGSVSKEALEYASPAARQNAPFRDIQMMLGWTSSEMIKIYYRPELEPVEGDAATRALKLIAAMDELNAKLPPAQETEKPLRPTSHQFRDLTEKYSNLSIARSYGISEAIGRMWMDKFKIKRTTCIQPDISCEEAAKVRPELEGGK